MKISLNIIFDSIQQYRHEVHADMTAEQSFRRVSLLPKTTEPLQPDCLYICRLSDVMRAPEPNTGICRICVRDRIHDDAETEQALTGTIIINENVGLETLFSIVQETFVSVNEWYQSMQEAIIRSSSLQDIISMSENVIGNFISVSDSALSLIAYTKNIVTDDPTSTFLIENGYHSADTINKFKKFKRYELWMNNAGPVISTDCNISNYTIISKVFAFNETYFTHVVMTCNNRPYTPGLLDLFKMLTDVLGFYINRIWEEKKDYDHVFSSLVDEVMQGKITDKDLIEERARIVGMQRGDEYAVMLLAGGGRGKSIFPGLMAQDIAKKFAHIRAVFYNCRLLLFIHHANIRKLFDEEQVESKLNDYFQENNIYCGMSEVFNDLRQLPAAYNQAELALEESDSEHRQGEMQWEPTQKWSHIGHFDTCFATSLLNRGKKAQQTWMNSTYGRVLLELAQADLEKNTNNIDVLYVYLINERRATETASALHMHRNNVVYRISRIEEMLNISLDDTVTRLNLMISFFMLRSVGGIQKINKYARLGDDFGRDKRS